MEMDSVALWMDTESNEERIERKILRDKSNIMEMCDKSFVQNFRLSKHAFLYVLHAIQCELSAPLRSTAVPAILKLGVTLKFMGQGGYQHQIGHDYSIGMAQQTTSSSIAEVCCAIENILCSKHINFKMSETKRREAKQHFFSKSGIPGVIGVVDGTHIQMIRPKRNEHLYFNRKLKHSINAMVICDHEMFIRAVNAKYGGAAHDSHVWNLSYEREYLIQKYENGDKSSWILGDSGYPLEPWILTAFRSTPENSPECYFNTKFSKAICLIERVFGILKGRFRCLLAARELHYAPEKVVQIMNVCCALHNICLEHNVALPSDALSSDQYQAASDNIEHLQEVNNATYSNIAKRIREEIAYYNKIYV